MSKAHKSPRRIRPSIRRDGVHPRDYINLKLMYACEDCSHFDSEKTQCTLGFNAQNHLKEHLEKMFELSGTMTLCRFHEID